MLLFHRNIIENERIRSCDNFLATKQDSDIFGTPNVNTDSILNCGQGIFRKYSTLLNISISFDLSHLTVKFKKAKGNTVLVYTKITLILCKSFSLWIGFFYQFYWIINELIYWEFCHIYGIVYNEPRAKHIYVLIHLAYLNNSFNKIKKRKT